MKKILFTLILLLAAGTVLAGPAVTVKQSQYHGWGHGFLALKENLTMSNSLNYYVLTAAQWKSRGHNPPQLMFWLFEPCGGGNFSRPNMDFFQLKVNDIRERVLPMRKEAITPWREKDRAGFEFTLRFDGAPIRVRWFMRPDSPVLWCTLTPGENQLTPFKSISLTLSAVPSRILYDKTGKEIYEGLYHRQGITAARILNQTEKPSPIALNDQDRYLILQDTQLDGSDREKGAGPCVIIPDRTANGIMQINICNRWRLTANTRIPVNFKSYTFGIWTRKNQIANQKLLKFVQDNPGQFTAK